MVIKSSAVGAETRRPAEQRAATFQGGDNEMVAAYTYLQRAVAIIAVLLPGSLVVGHRLFGGELLGSISAYYYTHMGNVFVGSLCALAVFFLSYSHRRVRAFELDNLLSRAACVAAVGVAVFPTSSNAVVAGGGEKLVSTLHLVFAGVLFGLLGVFSHFLFTKTNDPSTMTPEKQRRNRLYRTCGKLIFASMTLVIVSNVIQPPSSWHTLLWLETVCVLAFGTSWLVKGGFLGILADKTDPPN
ncbi:MAG: DUF998 domain-containing protein [Acidimicrobiales bacterium]